jgi:pyridoxine 4-dehydrogenase
VSADAAGTWTLGDRTVNRLGLGAMRLTGTAAFDHGVPRDRRTSIAVLRRAVELGVNHVDTAAFYFSSLRSANELIGAALAPYPDDLVIATKVGPGRDLSGGWLPFARPEQLRGQVEENLRQLGRDHLDVVNLRTYGPGPVADHVGALLELREAGLLRHVGLSNVGVAQLDEALALTPVVEVQNRYALDSRKPGSPAQVRLAWTLHQGPHVLAIPGTGTPAHLEENVAAAALRLTDAEAARLDGLYRAAG